MSAEWIGYLRVSTEEQTKGEGIAIQRDAIVAAAAAAGASVIAWCADEAVSGSNGLDSRHALTDALTLVRQHPGATIAVMRLDRLARDLMVQEQLLAEVWREGGRVFSCSEAEQVYCRPDDPLDPSRKFIRQVLGAVAEYERAMIRSRMVRGRRRKLAETGFAGGKQPYGWRYATGGGIEPDPTEQAVLASVTEWRAMGVDWKGCADELNGEGRVKRNGQPWDFRDLHKTMKRATERGLVSA